MKTHITLNGIHLYAHHGVAEQERLVGNDYTIDLQMEVSLRQEDMEADDVNRTVNYADVYHSVKQEMNHPSRLLEHVAWRIVGRLFKDFPPLQAVELHLKKRNPPMGADITSAGVRITVRREEWGRPA